MNPRLIIVVFVLAAAASPAFGQLEWHVSVKIILDEDGNRPSSGNLDTDAEVQAQIDTGNASLDATGRGYRLVLDEIVDLPGVSGWFDADVFTSSVLLEIAAELDPTLYAWRTDAINIYINGSNGTGICSFPATGSDIILLGQSAFDTTFLHEIGHFMSLCHTQGCFCSSCDPDSSGMCHDFPGDDEVDDTLPDLDCWGQDDIAFWSFGLFYALLSTSQQNQVDDVFQNVMSYHAPDDRDRLTDDQMDDITDTSNFARFNVATGHTEFVDGDSESLFQFGTSTDPWVAVVQGVVEADPGDIVLVRAATYPEVLTITKAVTLRASRGTVVIGEFP